jgi:hypothetical protein
MPDNGTLIHVGIRHVLNKGKEYLFLRRISSRHFVWFIENLEEEIEAGISASSAEEAMQLAHHAWKNYAFRTLICGFRYTLPERDEHGSNALFHQMVASYTSSHGIYFDEDLGHHCYIQNASQEALSLWKRLPQKSKK